MIPLVYQEVTAGQLVAPYKVEHSSTALSSQEAMLALLEWSRLMTQAQQIALSDLKEQAVA